MNRCCPVVLCCALASRNELFVVIQCAPEYVLGPGRALGFLRKVSGLFLEGSQRHHNEAPRLRDSATDGKRLVPSSFQCVSTA
jgi:hypothetical protein